MKKFLISLTFSLFFAVALASPDAWAKCNVCHSKNPKMVRMHKALEFKDCFNCHGSGRIEKPPKQKWQMKYDPLCSRCHG